MTVDLDGNTEMIVEVWGQPSGLGWLPDQSLLVVSMADRRLLRFHKGMLAEFASSVSAMLRVARAIFL